MADLSGLVCALLSFAALLAIVTAVGHGLWLLGAAIIGGVRPPNFDRRDRRPAANCVGCGEHVRSDVTRCSACGLDLDGQTAEELRDLLTTTRTLKQLADGESIEKVLESIERRRHSLMRNRRQGRNDIHVPPAFENVVAQLESWFGADLGAALGVEQKKRALAYSRALTAADLRELSAPALAGIARLQVSVGMMSRACVVYQALFDFHPASPVIAQVAAAAIEIACKLRDWPRADAFIAVVAGLPGIHERQPELAAAIAQAHARAAMQTPEVIAAPVAEARTVVEAPLAVVVVPEPKPATVVETVVPAAPGRSFAEWIGVFMEERNILWGELIGGTLIVGCSIALVISLWTKLEQIEFFPFLIFAAITSALFGAGFYTLHHWKLESTSRGLLMIGTLLVPLTFWALAGPSGGAGGGVLYFAAGGIGLALFGWLLQGAARILIQAPLDLRAPSAWLVTIAMMTCALAQLLAPRLLDSLPIGVSHYLLSVLPAIVLVGAMGWILLRLGTVESWSIARVVALVIALGSVTFACGVTLCLPLYAGGDLAMVLPHLSLAITLLSLPLLVAGTLIHQRLATLPAASEDGASEARALWRVVGTGLALFGLFVMFGGFAAAIKVPTLRWLSSVINIAALVATAWFLRVAVLHIPAQLFLATLFVLGWSVDLGTLSEEPQTVWRLSMLLVLQAILAEVLIRCQRPVAARYYAAGCAAVTALAGLLGVGRLAIPHPETTALVLGIAAVTWLAANLRWRRAEITYACSVAIAGTMFFTLRFHERDGSIPQQLLWSLLGQATTCLLGAIAVRFRSQRGDADWMRDSFSVPLEFVSLFATFFVAGIVLIEQVHGTLSWKISSMASGWLAALWLVLAALRGWPLLFGGFQAALGFAWCFGASAWLTARGWDWLEPYCLHVYGLGLGLMSLAWELVRRRIAARPTALVLLSPPFVPFDRLVTGGLVVGQYLLAALIALWGVGRELSDVPDTWRVFDTAWYDHACSPAAWLLPMVLAAVVIVRMRSSAADASNGIERSHGDLPMLGLTLLVLTLPLLSAGAWFDAERSSASALRWGLALAYGVCSLLLWNRHRLGMASAPAQPIRMLLIAGAVAPALMVTLIVVAKTISGAELPGPLAGVFVSMPGAASLLIPLGIFSAVLAGHGFRERLDYYLLAAGLLADASGVGGYVIALQQLNVPLDQPWVIVNGWLLAAGIAWGWSIIWTWAASRSQQRSLLESPLLTLNSWLGTILYGAALLPPLQLIVIFSIGIGRPWAQAAGSAWSWFVYGLAASGSCYLFWTRRTALPLQLLGALSLASVGVAACTMERWAPGQGFVALMFLSGLYPSLWIWANWFRDPERPPAWLNCSQTRVESVDFAVLSGALAVLLSGLAFVRGEHPIWAAQSVALVAAASALLVYQRKQEWWATLTSLLMVLAGTILVLHLVRGHPHRFLLIAQVELAVLGALSLLWLAAWRFITPVFTDLRQLKHLPVQLAVGVLSNLPLSGSALAMLIDAPAAPGSWPGLSASAAGWAALAANLAAAIWYASAVRPHLVVHLAGMGGVVLGVMFAGTADSLLGGDWMAFHVLTLTWTLVAATLLIASWGSHARFDAIVLQRAFPESATRIWVTLIGVFVVLLGLRASGIEPARPYWSIANTAAVSVLLGLLAVWARSAIYAYGAGLLFNVIALLLHAAWHPHRKLLDDLDAFLVGQIISFGAAAAIWSAAERMLARKRIELAQPIGLPFTQFTLLAGIGLAALWVGALSVTHLQRDDFPLGAGLLAAGWTAFAVLMAAALLDGWRTPSQCFTRFQLYAGGLTSLAFLLHQMNLSPPHWCLGATLLLAGYVLLIVVLSRCVHANRTLDRFLQLPEEAWFWPAQLVSIAVVVTLSVGINLAHAAWQERLCGAAACVLATLSALLLAPMWPRIYASADRSARLFPYYLALTLGLVVALEACGVAIGPEMPAIWLQRHAAALSIGVGIMLLYRFLVPTHRAGDDWDETSRHMSAILGVVSLALLVSLLGHEFVTFDPEVLKRTTPLVTALKLAAGLAIVGMTGLALFSALAKERDPYGMEGQTRSSYVYLTELLALAFLVHTRLNVPDLIPPVLGRYWYFSVMVLAFVGVALGEVFTRKNLPVLAAPLRRSAMVLAFVPALAFRLGPLTPFAEPIKAMVPGFDPFLVYLQRLGDLYEMEAFCWLLLGVFFGWIARLRASANFGIFGALALNFGVWVLLGHQDATTFFQRPQLWLIPLGLIVLVAEHINRERLGFVPSLTVRYVGLACIYLSSTIEMFKDGLGHAPILPIVLALLAVAGMLLGILCRVRAFLLAGFTALLVVVFAQIWHAAVDRGNTWLWWVCGILLGVAILTLFAVFEKHRNEVLKVLDNMKRWH